MLLLRGCVVRLYILRRRRWTFDLDIVAQAEIDESQEIHGTLNKDQHYYFKIIAKKETDGVRVQVKFRSTEVTESVFSRPLEPRTPATDMLYNITNEQAHNKL